MTRLSVNINKVALLRNARGGNLPDLIQFARDCEAYGAEGITVHPRPDQRHVRYSDIPALREVVTTEFNIEGNPTPEFLELVLAHPPHQCTLVPDAAHQLTSDHGWDTLEHADFLRAVIARLHDRGIRVSLFVDADPRMVEGAQAVGADRVELYTGPYAHQFPDDPAAAIAPYLAAAQAAHQCGLGLNAGHDLNLDNLPYFRQHCPHLLEVSIGHALISDALYFGIANTIRLYQKALQPKK
ncbi:MAG: pyridoxine 5'-phosphate synthase [Saprospiraceae bacterium]|nr:pyridoxine 5'-phosphate synthase [Saprospiraceae bacterium]MDW8228649.1 pyridoxine 5'-phosphate synthase [Saprospiraceae bacterium]